jgi:hypothetical protein
MKNACGKTRKVNEPYEVWRNDSGWEWRVLKKWQAPDKEPTGRLASPKVAYARWFCAVKSPMTNGSYDLGDVYVLEVIRNGVNVGLPSNLETW